MAFPDYAVTDDFNRANADPIGGGWSGKRRAADNNLKIVSNQVAHSTAAGAQGSQIYTTAFVRPFQAWVEVPDASSDIALDYCLQQVGGTAVNDGYRWQTNGTVLQCYRIRNDAFTQIGSNVAIDLVSGDALGVHLDYGGQHKLYHRTGGVWSLVATITDTTFISGYFGLVIVANASTRLDNFSAVQVPHGLATFPGTDTAVTDDFNRADVDPINTNWDVPTIAVVQQNLEINTNKVAHSTGAGIAGAAWWTVEQFTPPLEIAAKLGADGTNLGVDYCIATPGTAGADGYRWQTNTVSSITGRAVEMWRFDNGTFTLLTASHGVEAKDGDLLGARLVGTTHYLFYKPVDGSWQLVDTIVDATYRFGFAGIMVGGDAVSRLDDFRVAEIAPLAGLAPVSFLSAIGA